MAQNINDNLRLHAPKLLDDRAGPYASVAAALAGIPAYQRVEGLEVIIEVGGVQKKYWFDGGIADVDLVEIPSGGSGGYEPKNSIEVDAGELQLVGDELAPGNNKVYGTNGAGVKGWKDDPAGGSGGHVIEDDSTAFTQRANLQFLGNVTVEDDAVNDRTKVTITDPEPVYYPINTVVYYDDGKVKQVKTDIGGGLFIDKRVEYATTGDEIGKASLAEIKDESVSPALWKSITYNYTDGVLTSTTVADIVAWTITI